MGDFHQEVCSGHDCSPLRVDLNFSGEALRSNHEVIDITEVPNVFIREEVESDTSDNSLTDSTDSDVVSVFNLNNTNHSNQPLSTSYQKTQKVAKKHKMSFLDGCTVAKQPKLDVPEVKSSINHSQSSKLYNATGYSNLISFQPQSKSTAPETYQEILSPYLNCNHTITSGEYEDTRRQIDNNFHVSINSSITDSGNTDSETPFHDAHGMLVKNVVNSPQNINSESAECKTNDDIVLPISGDIGNPKPQNVKHDVKEDKRPLECSAIEPPVFYQLLDIFPDIDITFLKNLCQQNADLTYLTNSILEMSDNYPKMIKIPLLDNKCKEPNSTQLHSPLRENTANTSCFNEAKQVFDEVDLTIQNKETPSDETNIESNQYEFLLKVFPDADPTFLKRKSRLKGNKLETFIAESLEKNDYPRSTVKNVVVTENKTDAILMTDTGDSSKCVSKDTKTEIPVSCSNDLRNELGNDDIDTQKEEISQTISLDEPNKQSGFKQYDFLLGIFPDADPTFLETKSKLNGNELKKFITETLEKKDYPRLKIKNETANEEELNDFGLYTTMFNIHKFLKIFPDPFQYFYDKKRRCEKSNHAVEFMKRRYRHHSNRFIFELYTKCHFNLVKTCDQLDNKAVTRVTKRNLNEIHMPQEINLPFLQEACFIEHKPEIKEHIQAIEDAKKNAYEKAKENNELIECGCCYDQVLFEDCATCSEGDLFCKPCIQKSAEVRIGDGLTTFPCLIDCSAQFSIHLLQNLLEARVFSKLLQRIQIDEVKSAEIEGLESCPFCEFASIPPPETRIFTCLNPECLKESCRQCHKVSHIPLRCEEAENDDQAKARKYIEDEMTRALVRECYKCKKSFIKMDGCNKMTCTCGAKMCYICRQPITDYSHFNGPGGSNKERCPLYSTEKVLHVDAVKDVAQKALEEIKAANPNLNLKHDPTKVLPSAKAVSKSLPPGVNEQPVELRAYLQTALAANINNLIAGTANPNQARPREIVRVAQQRVQRIPRYRGDMRMPVIPNVDIIQLRPHGVPATLPETQAHQLNMPTIQQIQAQIAECEGTLNRLIQAHQIPPLP